MTLLAFLMGVIAGVIVYDMARIIVRRDSHYKRMLNKKGDKK
jgi:hypothetical protein